MLTDMQKQVVKGLAKIERKEYSTRDIVAVLRMSYGKDADDSLSGVSDNELTNLVNATLFDA